MQETRNEKQEARDEKQIAVKQEAGLPSTIDFEADAGSGFENLVEKSVTLPILKLLQNGSAEAKKRDPKYVTGAEPGMLYNTVTGKLYDGEKGVQVIPCFLDFEYQEWADFGTGSGRPEKIYPAESKILDETTKDAQNRDRLPNGNYIQTAAQWFVIVSDAKGSETVMMSFYGTQLPVSRKWNAAQLSISLDGKKGPYTPARYSHIWKLSTIAKSGKGNTWYVYKYELAHKLDSVKDANLYNRAKQFKANCEARTKNRKNLS
jgi:hypothetical protein